MISNVVWQIIEVTNTLLETLITYWFFKDFLGKRPGLKEKINVLCFFALFATASILYFINPDQTFTLLFTVASRILYSLLFDSNIKAKIFISFLIISLSLLSEYMAYYTILLLSEVTAQTLLQDGIFRVVGIVVSNIYFLITSRILGIVKKRKKFIIPTLYWIILLVVPVLSIIIMYTIYSYSRVVDIENFRILSYITDISILFINYTIFYLFNKLIEDFNFRTHYKLLEQQISYQESHYKDLEISNNNIRSLRHDIKNHLQCLSELVRTNQIREAEEYLRSVADILTVKNRVITTGNSVLDSILNAKLMAIKEKSINFQYIIEIPNQIKIEPVDICVIWGNSLDNAIEACERIHSGAKNISMIISYKNSSLFYSIANSTNGKLIKNGGFFLSSKNNFLEHGLGLSNIQRTVEKYNGIVQIEHRNNTFQLSTVLYNV